MVREFDGYEDVATSRVDTFQHHVVSRISGKARAGYAAGFNENKENDIARILSSLERALQQKKG